MSACVCLKVEDFAPCFQLLDGWRSETTAFRRTRHTGFCSGSPDGRYPSIPDDLPVSSVSFDDCAWLQLESTASKSLAVSSVPKLSSYWNTIRGTVLIFVFMRELEFLRLSTKLVLIPSKHSFTYVPHGELMRQPLSGEAAIKYPHTLRRAT